MMADGAAHRAEVGKMTQHELPPGPAFIQARCWIWSYVQASAPRGRCDTRLYLAPGNGLHACRLGAPDGESRHRKAAGARPRRLPRLNL